MQDKSNMDSFELPVDQGWESMSAQLDEAMPQQRRRLFLWWWLLGLLLVGVVGGYAWAQINPGLDTETEPLTTEVQQPVASTMEPAVSETQAQSNASTTTKAETEPTETNTIKQAVSGNRTSGEITSFISQTETESDTRLAPLPKEGVGLEQPSSTNNDQALSPAQVQNDVITASPLNPEVVTDVVETRPLADITNPLDNRAIELLSFDKVDHPSELELTSVKRRRSIPLYVEAFGGESLVDPFPSIAGGLGMEHRLGANLRLNTGLQYQVHRTQLFNSTSRSDALFSEAFPSAGIQNGAAYDISAAYQALETQRLNAYAQVSYAVHPRVHVGLGVQSGYFLKAKSEISGEALFPDPNGTEDVSGVRVDLYDESVAPVSFDQFSNAYTAPLEVRRWQWSALGMVSYRWHRAWSLELQYLRHLTHWPAQRETFGGPHNIQLGLRYYLRK